MKRPSGSFMLGAGLCGLAGGALFIGGSLIFSGLKGHTGPKLWSRHSIVTLYSSGQVVKQWGVPGAVDSYSSSGRISFSLGNRVRRLRQIAEVAARALGEPGDALDLTELWKIRDELAKEKS